MTVVAERTSLVVEGGDAEDVVAAVVAPVVVVDVAAVAVVECAKTTCGTEYGRKVSPVGEFGM